MRLLVLLCIIYVCECRPLPHTSIVDECNDKCVLDYLIRFGYLEPETENEIKGSDKLQNFYSISEGVARLQKDAGFKETGIMDERTKNLLTIPRCGVPSLASLPRHKRYSIVSNKWMTPSNDLNETIVTWYFDSSNFKDINTTMSPTMMESLFSTTLSRWANTSLLNFQQVYDIHDANITIKFEGGNHGDGYNFDGPGKILAHAFYPGFDRGGDVHLDLGENWTTWQEKKGVSLYAIAIHEFGHSLGIGHSSQEGAVMYPWYTGENIELTGDDIMAVNFLYGPRSKWGLLDPKYRIYNTRPTTTTDYPETTTSIFSSTTTLKPHSRRTQKTKTRQWLNWPVGRLTIENSRVFIYPKSSTTLTF